MAFSVQSTSLDMSRSTIAELLHVHWSSVMLKVQPLPRRPSGRSGRTVNRKSLIVCQVAIRGPRQCPEVSSPNVDTEADFIPTFVDVEHTLKHKTCFFCPQNVMYQELVRSASILYNISKLHPQRMIVWKRICAPRVVIWMQSIIVKY